MTRQTKKKRKKNYQTSMIWLVWRCTRERLMEVTTTASFETVCETSGSSSMMPRLNHLIRSRLLLSVLAVKWRWVQNKLVKNVLVLDGINSIIIKSIISEAKASDCRVWGSRFESLLSQSINWISIKVKKKLIENKFGSGVLWFSLSYPVKIIFLFWWWLNCVD